jgi:hypothetical protein
VPVIFTLAADEVTTYEAPPPYHMCLPRQSLLPFVLEPVREFFKPFAPPFGGEMWLEFQAVPLRWQMPTGVLFDLLVGDDAGDALPWALTVRFQGFPATKLLRASVEAAEAVLMNALKESCCLLCGSAQPAMTLSKDAQDGLRRAIATNDFEAFASVRRALAPSPHPPADTHRVSLADRCTRVARGGRPTGRRWRRPRGAAARVLLSDELAAAGAGAAPPDRRPLPAVARAGGRAPRALCRGARFSAPVRARSRRARPTGHLARVAREALPAPRRVSVRLSGRHSERARAAGETGAVMQLSIGCSACVFVCSLWCACFFAPGPGYCATNSDSAERARGAARVRIAMRTRHCLV